MDKQINRSTAWSSYSNQQKYIDFIDKWRVTKNIPPTVEDLLEVLAIIFNDDGYRLRAYNKKLKRYWEFAYYDEENECWNGRTQGDDLWGVLWNAVKGYIES